MFILLLAASSLQYAISNVRLDKESRFSLIPSLQILNMGSTADITVVFRLAESLTNCSILLDAESYFNPY